MSFFNWLAELVFLAPERLFALLVIPVLIVAYIFAMMRKNRRGMRFTNTSMLEAVIPKQSQWRRHLAVALSILSLVTLSLAWARPSNKVDVPRERATVVIALDSSLSMQAEDVKPTRLDAAKQAAVEFVEQLPDKYNISVVSFAGTAAILSPPTLDHNTVENTINGITLHESTAIGEAIATSLRALSQAPKDPDDPKAVAPGAIVLLSEHPAVRLGFLRVGFAPARLCGLRQCIAIGELGVVAGCLNGAKIVGGKVGSKWGANSGKKQRGGRRDSCRDCSRAGRQADAEPGAGTWRPSSGVERFLGEPHRAM